MLQAVFKQWIKHGYDMGFEDKTDVGLAGTRYSRLYREQPGQTYSDRFRIPGRPNYQRISSVSQLYGRNWGVEISTADGPAVILTVEAVRTIMRCD